MEAKDVTTMFRKSLILSVISIMLFFSCRPDTLIEPTDVENGSDFFPFALHKSWLWEVDSIIYDPIGSNQPIDTIKAYIRETVTDTFSTPTGLAWVMERYSSRDSVQGWIYSKTFTVTPQVDKLLWNEDNLILIKALHPIYSGLTWDGTAFFDPLIRIPIAGELMQPFKGWAFLVLGKGDSLMVDNKHWTDVLSIRQADSENLLERRLSVEFYQRGVGLVYRKMEILDTQCNGNPAACEGIPWSLKAEKGYILEQHLISYQ
ncbi:MAG: hypothetical protein KA479_02035 [Saprospiraceae bacterium]|jgi:hypothetical protein|nr:hypothetical protein [Saprospiraceae bacterium]